MTLIVALRGTDGLVLGADTRGTIGDPRGLTAINDDQTKLFELSRYCGVGLSGASELAAKVLDELKPKLAADGLEFADEILDATRELVRSRYDDWFAKFPVDQRPALLLVLVGYQRADHQPMVPRTYLLSNQIDFAPQLFPNGNCLAGVPQYAIYLMHRLYDPAMTVANLTRLAAYLISETATQDPKVGGPIRIATITPGTGFQELGGPQLDDIIKKNSEQNETLKRFFFEGGTDGKG